MKRYCIGAAVMAVLASACTNEEIVKQNMENGQLFEITADHGMASRTVLNDDANKTLWQAGDKIFVTSLDGDVTGELTLKKGAGQEKATFAGKVNGDVDKLRYAVYPAPVDGKIDMSRLADGELDAPMFGEMDDLNVTFKNECALVKVQIEGAAGKDVKVEVEGLAGGQYELDREDYSVSLKYTGNEDGMTITDISEDGVFYVPVYAGSNIVTLDAAAARTAAQASVTKVMAITIGDQTIEQEVTIEKGKIYKNVETMQYVEGEYFNKVLTIGYDSGALKAAIENGDNVILSENASMQNRKLYIKHGKKATLDLGGNKLFINNSIILAQGELTVKNGTVVASNFTSGSSAVYLYSSDNETPMDAVLNIEEDVTIEASGTNGVCIYNTENESGKATVNFAGKVEAGNAGLITNGNNVGECVFNVTEGAEIKAPVGIYLPTGQANVAGGEIIGTNSAVEIRGGELSIAGGKLKATTTKDFKIEENGNGSTIEGAAVAISQHATNLPISVTISGGEFDGIYSVYEEDIVDVWYVENIKINVTGGTFNAPVKSENVKNFIAGGTFKNFNPAAVEEVTPNTTPATFVSYLAENATVTKVLYVQENDKDVTTDVPSVSNDNGFKYVEMPFMSIWKYKHNIDLKYVVE